MKPLLRWLLLFCVISGMSIPVFASPQTNAASWAKENVLKAYETGLVPEYLLTQATANISRLDFTILAAQFFTKTVGEEVIPSNPTPFIDVDNPAITFAYEKNIISGRTPTEFYPNQNLTREQMAIIIQRTLVAVGAPLSTNAAPAPFVDMAALPKVSNDAVNQLYQAKIISGSDGYYYPTKDVTVQEAILVFYNTFGYFEDAVSIPDPDLAMNPMPEEPSTKPLESEQATQTEKPTQPEPIVAPKESETVSSKTETPKTETPKTETPKTETPKTETPKTTEKTTAPIVGNETEIKIGAKTLTIGGSVSDLKKAVGLPDRIDQDSYGYERYIYAAGSADMFFVSVSDGKIIEIYTGSDNFEYLGVKGTQSKKDIKNIKFHDQRNFRVELQTSEIDATILLDNAEGIEGIILRDKLFRSLVDRRYNKTFEENTVVELMDLINQARRREGQSTVINDATAASIATKHSFNMSKNDFVEYNDHTGKTPFDRMSEGGLQFKMAAELAGKYEGDSVSIYHEWMRNIGTRSNILNGSLTHGGIGIYMDNYAIYATADLFKP